MKYYVEFLEVNSGTLQGGMGSDAYFILDGRNNIETMKVDAMVRMHKLKIGKPWFVGYRIYKTADGRFNGTQLVEWIISGTQYNKQ